ncbi:hypothetical protein LTR62_008595 [Meristemomyces frigidus]|uniref:Beta-xylosidase C-terminal Concanavalin A-like domain-containing protein n=1 Tax=Meristemomyces frigidus TaxID=1508187 RepID=A0AAN7TAJ4_9PEZI|nr:hypothetical protein LTR62_008595 [Meristemomyces frigidus]
MAATEFINPIVPGFAPDPSVVFDDGLFFLVNSSFHVFPGLPIYASPDLQNWKQIGNAIHRPSQKIDLSEANSVGFPIGPGKVLVATVGLVAPTIRHHKGTFYVLCTNASHSPDGRSLITKNFYVTSKDIWSGEWSDPTWFDFTGIDTSLFFDDDDRAYIQGSWREGLLTETVCTIRQFEVDIGTGRSLSETKELWKGFFGKDDAEGPHIYKKDGYYFLVTAECGTFEHHAISVARSRDIWGPYESYEQNPILTAFGTSEYIQNTGHGELFQDGSGRWWCTCLGIRNDHGRYPLGRETFLAPVSWSDGGWPRIKHPQMKFSRESPLSTASVIPLLQSIPRVDFLYIRDARLEDYTIDSDQLPADGSQVRISLVPSQTTLSTETGTASFVGKRQRSLNCTVTATLHLDQRVSPVEAGLAIYKEDLRHVEIYYDSATSTINYRQVLKLKGAAVSARKSVSVRADMIKFRIKAEPHQYTFEYSTDGKLGWVEVGKLDTLDITGYDFSGPILGVFATTEDGDSKTPVRFNEFQISGNS